MRVLSVRGLIVAVALAAQAVVASYGFGAAPAVGGERGGGAALCDQQRRHFERRAPEAPSERDPAACFSCQLCLDGSSPVPMHVGAARHARGRDGILIAWPPRAHMAARSTLARSHRARAPPLHV
jgi:hypothetical protein